MFSLIPQVSSITAISLKLYDHCYHTQQGFPAGGDGPTSSILVTCSLLSQPSLSFLWAQQFRALILHFGLCQKCLESLLKWIASPASEILIQSTYGESPPKWWGLIIPGRFRCCWCKDHTWRMTAWRSSFLTCFTFLVCLSCQ